MKKLLLLLLLLTLSILYIPIYSNHGPITHSINWDYDLTHPLNVNVVGFKIYCGSENTESALNFKVDISDNTVRSYLLYDLQLPDGIHYCAMTAYDTYESIFSNIVSIEIKDWDLVIYTPGTPLDFYLE